MSAAARAQPRFGPVEVVSDAPQAVIGDPGQHENDPIKKLERLGVQPRDPGAQAIQLSSTVNREVAGGLKHA